MAVPFPTSGRGSCGDRAVKRNQSLARHRVGFALCVGGFALCVGGGRAVTLQSSAIRALHATEGRIFLELMTPDRQLKPPREGSK